MVAPAATAAVCAWLPACNRSDHPYDGKTEAAVKNVTKVIKSRFEVGEGTDRSYLEFETDGQGWMTIWHTEVAVSRRGQGIGLQLVETAFEYARENSLRVDVICPLALHLVDKRPEFKALMGKR
jgi:uncharacterized protein